MITFSKYLLGCNVRKLITKLLVISCYFPINKYRKCIITSYNKSLQCIDTLKKFIKIRKLVNYFVFRNS